jgi:glyoxylase-like metal-dependent hydrolase (beta-lactamase superfamily II)
MVQAAAETFGCPVYATEEYADVLENPGAYHLPALPVNAVKKVTVVEDGQVMKWHEFTLTFHFFPGQTLYHGALLAEKAGERPILFVGDSFAPSGIDDYCVLNRNFVHPGSGFLRCLKTLRSIDRDFWLINEHIPYVFAFSADELDYIEDRYHRRIAIMRELFPWDDPNYGIDEQWAFFYPYALELSPGETSDLEVRVTNHSPVERTFHVMPRTGQMLELAGGGSQLTLQPRQSGEVKLRIRAGSREGNTLVTADIRSEGMEFRHWVESLVTIR